MKPSAESKHRRGEKFSPLPCLTQAKLQSEEEISLEAKTHKTLIPFFEFFTIPVFLIGSSTMVQPKICKINTSFIILPFAFFTVLTFAPVVQKNGG